MKKQIILLFSKTWIILSLLQKETMRMKGALSYTFITNSVALSTTQQAAFRHSIVFQHFMEPRNFITTFTTAFRSSLSWARPIQSMLSHPISLRSILMLSIHLHLSVFLVVSFPLDFPPIIYTRSSSPPIRATCTAHLILVGLSVV
jgi:hypothetical protein